MLDGWSTQAAFRRPFEFYAGVLGRDGVRALMIARLGQEAGDILDEFLSFCLAQERIGLPGLESLLSMLEATAPEIKREMDQTRNEVRIMTVHAAKGLEAPVVFLVDGGSAPFHPGHLPRLLPFKPAGALRPATGYVWRAPGEASNAFLDRQRALVEQRADDEYRRLLYVGMTRAEDRLVVCGHHGVNLPKATTWHSIVSRSLSGIAESSEIDDPVAGRILRFRVTADRSPPSDAPDTDEALAALPFPEHLRTPLPPVPDLPRPLAPSGAAALLVEAGGAVISGRSPVLEPDADDNRAIVRGLAVHRLLQMLPDLPPPDREAAARRYLDRTAAGWAPDDRDGVLESVMAILDTPEFRHLFSPGSRAEVAIMGELDLRGHRRTVSGKIDRLGLTEAGITIVDYKTNRPAPATIETVPEAYIVQLALYRALLAPIYPGRPVSAALLFTDAPRLIVVPADAMDDALVRLANP